ncbi:MAG: glucose-1-phosphate adenylyltransferase, partial [Anaerolineales bacterium]|nr:glucose-1-phosphate adenylyltransferase [Anaerolineales bacterium]
LGVYIFNLGVLDKVLWEDRMKSGTSHDFGKDILPRLVLNGARVFAFPYTGYWVDVGTVESYWQAHMDLLETPPSLDLNDRSWIIHTRTEERPPVRIGSGANVRDSMVTDGCVIEPGAFVERSILSPGVRVLSGAIIRESVILTDSIIEEDAKVERTIVDKQVKIGRQASVGGIDSTEDIRISMIGKNSHLPPRIIVEPASVIATDVIPSDFPGMRIPSGTQVYTKRQAYEV